ncbi:MAG TPA: phosphoadenylyl-sulfate reductase [Burkholderiales bacterium]|nr:phosphoadenylyl-sulfate reductase [Burkholderiales bacterium]
MKLEGTLQHVAAHFSPVALASSLSAEDMVITDTIARFRLPIEVFVLDTGRLHADTLSLLNEIRTRYPIAFNVYEPDPRGVEQYVAAHGRDAFYGSVELRKRCCELRKVEPLRRALAGKRAWITGQRREHAASRAALAESEFDPDNGLHKFNPLAGWSEAEVWQYVRAHQVPYNRLYDQGYRSIGCAPCTRPVVAGEDPRAGRWWWEIAEHKECGLHPRKRELAHAR